MFGLFQQGILNVTVASLTIFPLTREASVLRFSIDRNLIDANTFLDSRRDMCFNDELDIDDDKDHIYTAVAQFKFDFKNKLHVLKSKIFF